MVDSTNYFENLRIKEEEDHNAFSAIKLLFENQCEQILQTLYLKGYTTVSPSDLEKCGFNLACLVKSISSPENVLFRKINYYNENHFIDYDLKLQNSSSDYFEIIKTNNSKEKIGHLNLIRSKKIELENYENAASAYLQDVECRDLELSKHYKDLANKVKLEITALEAVLDNLV